MSANSQHILAIVGTYRKGGIIDTAVDEILSSAREAGAEAKKIYLVDKHLLFCTNCRSCTQQPGPQYGTCVLEDDMKTLLQEVDQADAIILASPVNAGTVTAVMKVFIERLVCTAFWPWGALSPKYRNATKKKHAVLVASSAAPAVMARFAGDITKRLKTAATMLGARSIGTLFIGLAAQQQHQDIGIRARKKARLLGKKLAEGH